MGGWTIAPISFANSEAIFRAIQRTRRSLQLLLTGGTITCSQDWRGIGLFSSGTGRNALWFWQKILSGHAISITLSTKTSLPGAQYLIRSSYSRGRHSRSVKSTSLACFHFLSLASTPPH